MTEPIIIHKRPFYVNPGEFDVLELPNLSPMKVKKDLADLDREIAFLSELTEFSKVFTNIGNLHGGYVPITLRHIFNIVSIPNKTENILKNMEAHQMKDCFPDYTGIVRIDPAYNFSELPCNALVILSDNLGTIIGYETLMWNRRCVYVHNSIYPYFSMKFRHCIKNKNFTFDNLVNMLIMVKDAGDEFREVLKANIPFIDHWTILDTGSTDNTINIIKEELQGVVPGELYREPFINFRDSRNRLLDLAGNKFAFNIMLDDTYVMEGNIREFLTLARADDEFESLSIYIKDTDIMYSSNRITKPEKCLKYKYTIHEIIEPNYNGCMPLEFGYVVDRVSPYMKQRTTDRKQKDLDLLFDEVRDDPDDARLYYYIAETLLCMESWKEAYKYYEIRSKMDGYEEEVQDSLYKMAVLAHIHLGESKGYPWEKVQQLYMNCYEYNPTKPEAIFMIGKTLLEMGKKHNAYLYLKRALEIGQTSGTMNNRIKISNFYTPYFLLPLARELGDNSTVEKCQKMLENYRE